MMAAAEILVMDLWDAGKSREMIIDSTGFTPDRVKSILSTFLAKDDDWQGALRSASMQLHNRMVELGVRH